MIIEGAFYKLIDIFLAETSPETVYEQQLVSHFAMAVVLEFQSRNIPYPLLNIKLEKPYPKHRSDHELRRGDLFVEIPNEGKMMQLVTPGLKRYGVCLENWIEIKFFGGLKRTKGGTETKTDNVGMLIADLLKMKAYAPKDSCKYLIVGFNDDPKHYLAWTNKKTGRKREYLDRFFEEGRHKDIFINLDEEPKWLKVPIQKEIKHIPERIKLNTFTIAIEPSVLKKGILPTSYWFYLIKLVD